MSIKYIPYYLNTVKGQAIPNNFIRTRRALKYRDNDKVYEKIKRGMPYYEVEKTESVGLGKFKKLSLNHQQPRMCQQPAFG